MSLGLVEFHGLPRCFAPALAQCQQSTSSGRQGCQRRRPSTGAALLQRLAPCEALTQLLSLLQNIIIIKDIYIYYRFLSSLFLSLSSSLSFLSFSFSFSSSFVFLSCLTVQVLALASLPRMPPDATECASVVSHKPPPRTSLTALKRFTERFCRARATWLRALQEKKSPFPKKIYIVYRINICGIHNLD